MIQKKSPFACVHCPHCDHHLCTWGDVQRAIRAVEETVAAKTDDGGWTVCPRCIRVIHVQPDGEHVAPTEEQVAATSQDVKAAIGRQVWMAQTAKDAMKHGVMVSFSELIDEDDTTTRVRAGLAVVASVSQTRH
jgi:hypothetical protein